MGLIINEQDEVIKAIEPMTVIQIIDMLDAQIVTGRQLVQREINYGFASDLMSDVLTQNADGMLMITGLTNVQTIRTAEIADISCILFVRGKKVTPAMIAIAKENDIVLLECKYSMFRAAGILYNAGLTPIY